MLLVLAAFCGLMAVVCGWYGFTGLATALRNVAKVSFLVFVVAAVVLLILGVL